MSKTHVSATLTPELRLEETSKQVCEKDPKTSSFFEAAFNNDFDTLREKYGYITAQEYVIKAIPERAELKNPL